MPVTAMALRRVLTNVANWQKKRQGLPPLNVSPPGEVAEVLTASGDWPCIPELQGIVSAPVFGPDGTVCTAPGYHPATHLYYHGPSLELGGTAPTPANIAAAKHLLMEEWLGEFPYPNPDQASRAHTLAFVLVPFVRPMIDGPTPLHLIDAPTPGTGKTLLVHASTLIFTAQPVSAMTMGRNEEETRKRLTSKLVKAPSHVFWDNVTELDSANLAAAFTGEVWEDRILGRSLNVSLPIRCIWVATSNNAVLSPEITRRTIWIRLDANSERPYLGRTFRHTNLLRWTREHRAELITAALTLVRAWIEAGRPAYSGSNPSPGSFEAWADVMGGILETIGVDGFLANAHKLYDQAEPQSGAWRGFVEAWHEKFGEDAVGAKNLLSLAREWIDVELGDRGDRSQSIRLGQALHKSVDRIFGHFQIVHAGQQQRAGQFRVKRLRGDGESGESGESSRSPVDHTEGDRTRPGIQQGDEDALEGHSRTMACRRNGGPDIHNNHSIHRADKRGDGFGRNGGDFPDTDTEVTEGEWDEEHVQPLLFDDGEVAPGENGWNGQFYRDEPYGNR